MRTKLKVGLLAAAIGCAAFVAARAQEEKSYLPPQHLQGKPETAAPRAQAPTRSGYRANRARYARSYTRRRHVAVYRNRHNRVRAAYYRTHRRYYAYHPRYRRYAYYPRYRRYAYYPRRYAYYRPAFPGFMFGLYRW